MTVKWKGPNGEVDEDSNENLVKLLFHEKLKSHFSKEELNNVSYLALSGLDFLRELYSSRKLSSRYHNLGHNYVTTITSIKTFIGALSLGKAVDEKDLISLIIAALFHDSGYLLNYKAGVKREIRDHNLNSILFTEIFLAGQRVEDEICDKVLHLIKYTDYSECDDFKNEIKHDFLGQVLIGADLLQVTDKRYFVNRNFLEEYLYKNESETDEAMERRFFKFVQELTSNMWNYLDAYYKTAKTNPYRTGWQRFVKAFQMICGEKDLK
ncbi:MAG: hypothetical protein ABIE03_03430 [Patescibacteria group bacterium]|nr:hypothetical protein [Patescibacteria group bacterium]